MTEEADYIGHRHRLRERFLSSGGKGIADYELLELLLMYAQPRKDVKPLSKLLLKQFKSLNGVLNAPQEDLLKISGVKEGVLTVIKLVCECGCRMSWQKLEEGQETVLSNWDSLLDYCRTVQGYSSIEEFRIIFLNNKCVVLGEEVQQRGTVNQVSVHPREVVKSAINKGASYIILVHNHPSGDVTPSKADIQLTKQIKEGLAAVGITVLEHIIVGQNLVYSFKDHGLI